MAYVLAGSEAFVGEGARFVERENKRGNLRSILFLKNSIYGFHSWHSLPRLPL